MKEFDCNIERYFSTMEVAGKRFERALVPPGEYICGWERGARVRLPDDRQIAWCRFVLIDSGVTGVRIGVCAERGSAKWRRIARSLGISPQWGDLPISLDDADPIQILTLEPLAGFGSVVRAIKPARPEDVDHIGSDIFLELEREEWG